MLKIISHLQVGPFYASCFVSTSNFQSHPCKLKIMVVYRSYNGLSSSHFFCSSPSFAMAPISANSTSKQRVAPPGILPPAPLSPYPRSDGITYDIIIVIGSKCKYSAPTCEQSCFEEDILKGTQLTNFLASPTRMSTIDRSHYDHSCDI